MLEEQKMVMEIGRVCMKIAGRDAGKKCVIVDVLEGSYVLIDGETRRRKCNIMHLEPLDKVVKIKKNASHDEVSKVLKAEGIETRVTKPKQKKDKPKKLRGKEKKAALPKEEKGKKKDVKKEKAKKPEAEKPSLEEKAGLEEKK